ncbi:MAG: GH25 family lysozyme [Clostridiaceae bacterium]|nr:GH25 family lysozyme [Clostridiaceae bacterium]
MKKLVSGFLVILMLTALTPNAWAKTKSFEVSDQGVEFIKTLEGFTKKPYLDNGQWRVGYGTVCTSNDYVNGISEEEATELFKVDLKDYADKVNTYLSENSIDAKQSQFDALVSFTYNLGSGWMNPSYKFSSYLIAGIENYDDIDVLNAYVVWCHVGKTVDDVLLKRRIAEGKLLLYGDYKGDESPDYTYAIFDSNGGTADTDVKCFLKGTKLTSLPLAQREGYIMAGWYASSGKAIKETEVMDDPMELTAKWFLDVKLPFTDIPGESWYYHYVGQLFSDGVVDGMTSTTFEPQGDVTYGQALKLVLLATGLEPSDDDDTSGHWAQKYKNMAVDAGIVSSDFGSDLNASISRIEIAALAAKAMGLSNSVGDNPFVDTQDKNVMALYNAGIVEGTTENDGMTYYYPKSCITRAEITTIIWRILSHTADNSHIGQIQYGSYVIDILKGVDRYKYNDTKYYEEGGFLYYNGAATYAGIDVSVHQGTIDWQKVKKAGVHFAMIRVGGRGYGMEGNMYDDVNFQKNIEGAIAAGINVGVYYFSQAITVDEAKEEANYVLKKIQGYDISYPVVFDWERIGGNESRTYGLETDLLCQIANTFCGMVKDAGYTPMIYFNSYCGYIKYDLSKINQYGFWFARYSDTPGFYYNFQMWQYSDKGSVSGISGNVDLNLSFVDYASKK